MAERYYIYAIAAPDIRLPEGSAPTFGGPLRIIPRGELVAVVSHLSAEQTGGAVPAASAENLLRHETVVEAVRAGGPALPVRFGTVLPDADAVVGALASQDEALRDALRRIGDKVELGVSALWRPERADSGGLARGPGAGRSHAADATAADATAADRHPGLGYLRARQAEYRRTASLRVRAEELARELDAALCPHAHDVRRGLCPSERLALRDVYLLERERVGAFEEAFEELRRRQREVRFLLSGPWPPYSFVTPPSQRPAEPQSHERTERITPIGSDA